MRRAEDGCDAVSDGGLERTNLEGLRLPHIHISELLVPLQLHFAAEDSMDVGGIVEAIGSDAFTDDVNSIVYQHLDLLLLQHPRRGGFLQSCDQLYDLEHNIVITDILTLPE